ncbi:hypothetical protein H5410_054077 [Solanum commersonii]|uniref:Uncharacterized protein n=1 Tax=Solanum commersonii TaxID=4109 RepID=A0A9J5X6E4_SOLCO|nr:hypothetical protein H5410_054077 [Solanum commersonii]
MVLPLMIWNHEMESCKISCPNSDFISISRDMVSHGQILLRARLAMRYIVIWNHEMKLKVCLDMRYEIFVFIAYCDALGTSFYMFHQSH